MVNIDLANAAPLPRFIDKALNGLAFPRTWNIAHCEFRPPRGRIAGPQGDCADVRKLIDQGEVDADILNAKQLNFIDALHQDAGADQEKRLVVSS